MTSVLTVMLVVPSVCASDPKGFGVGSLPRHTWRPDSLAGTRALHHLLGLLLPHTALSHRLEQPAKGETASESGLQGAHHVLLDLKHTRWPLWLFIRENFVHDPSLCSDEM